MLKRISVWLAVLALIVAAAAAVTVIGAGLGYRWGAWGLTSAFATLSIGAFIGMGGAALALIGGGLAAVAGARWAVLGGFLALSISAIAIALPLDMKLRAERSPPIHDITTDMDNPPAFVALREARQKSANGFAYEGAAVARQQREAYPDIGPVRARFLTADVLARAQAIARDLGWEIVAVTADGFEASVKTAWWGFIDDISVRVRADGEGSIVDIRSASRIGKSDLGVNAARVRAFIARFKTPI